MNRKTKWIISGIFLALFLLWIVLLKTVDVRPVGPAGTSIGFATVNTAFQDAFTFNKLLYTVTKLLGVLTIAVAGAFAIFGVVQWIQRRKLLRVDLEIRNLAVLYVVFAALYVFFEKVIINYRPMIMPNETEPEASFPSTHTMLVCVVMGSTILLLKKYIHNDVLRLILQIVSALIIVVMVVGRLLCGVHWLTDIIGGVLISAALVSAYAAMIDKGRKKRRH
jgi:undecaprenyl-diphosphatase